VTPEQRDKFIAIAQMGVTCGLATPEEWLLNYTLHQSNFEAYPDIPANYEAALEAFAAFWRDTASYQEEQEFFNNSTPREIIDYIYQNKDTKLVP
jgi:hypothetical protein